MKKTFPLFLLFCLFQINCEAFEESVKNQKIVLSTKRIVLEDFPGAFNPSIIAFGDEYLLTFRFIPDLQYRPWMAYIGVVRLNHSFEQIGKPQLLSTRPIGSKIPSQSEDARIFSYRGRTFLTYNDNAEQMASYYEPRYIYLAELHYSKGRFSLSKPLKLIHEEKQGTQRWQKNWIPFEWNKTLLMSYMLSPHEVIYPNLNTGLCYRSFETNSGFQWDFGTIRGSTPATLVDGEYLAFFHSGTVLASTASGNQNLWHYFMGAYTFSSEPPFEVTKFTRLPIVGEGFYTQSGCEKRVVFPGGYVVDGSKIHVAYGKDDCEVWIATLDKEALKEALAPVPSR